MLLPFRYTQYRFVMPPLCFMMCGWFFRAGQSTSFFSALCPKARCALVKKKEETLIVVLSLGLSLTQGGLELTMWPQTCNLPALSLPSAGVRDRS